MWAIATNAPTSWQKDVRRCLRSHCPTCWAGNIQAIVITRLKSPLAWRIILLLATVNKKPFTFILETERGLNLSIQAVPREGAGRTIQLVSDLRGTGEEAGAWETSTPYESLLVTISQAVRGGKLPAGWYQVPVTKETLQAPAGLSSVADAVWTGNHLKMVRFAVENKTLSALNIRESDFWQPGTRAVMFSQPASQLLAGARMDVYVIRDGEGN